MAQINCPIGGKCGCVISSVQSLRRIRLFATPWTAARQASLSFPVSWSLLKLMSIELVMPSKHLIFCGQCQSPKDIVLCWLPAPILDGAGNKVWPSNASPITLDSRAVGTKDHQLWALNAHQLTENSSRDESPKGSHEVA